MKYAEIIDKGECLATLYTFPQISWPEPFLKDVANRNEWAKQGFYPSDGLVAEIPYTIERDMSKKIDIKVYILRINERFYVPMTDKGLRFISESEYRQKRPANTLRNMDKRQQRINDGWDLWQALKCNI